VEGGEKSRPPAFGLFACKERIDSHRRQELRAALAANQPGSRSVLTNHPASKSEPRLSMPPQTASE
jgi:hypothetical protein